MRASLTIHLREAGYASFTCAKVIDRKMVPASIPVKAGGPRCTLPLLSLFGRPELDLGVVSILTQYLHKAVEVICTRAGAQTSMIDPIQNFSGTGPAECQARRYEALETQVGGTRS